MRSSSLAILVIPCALVLVLSLLVGLAAPAAAQEPLPGAPTPIYTVTIQNAPAEFPALVANGTANAPFQVVLTLGNVVCGATVTIPVTLTATAAGAPAFFRVMPEPAILNFTVGQGPHGSGTGAAAAGGTGDSAAKATITGNITANASVSVTLVASAPAPASGPTGCQGAGAISAATSDPVVVFANMTATPAPPVVEPTPEDTPGFGLVALVAAAAIAVGLRRKQAGP